MSKLIELGEVLKYEQPTKYIVGSELYDDSYKIPVLTAGKSFILGYTNETENIYQNYPVIIFDDFTTAIKFVDFPFKVKSSAMKILSCDNEKADIRFLFYVMQTLKINSEQHQRYWISKYSKIKIPLPPLSKQKAIAEKLDKADALRKKDQQLLAKYAELAQSLFIDMFGDPVKNEKGWEFSILDKVCNKITDGEHGTVERLNAGHLYLMARNVRNNEIDFTEVSFISEKDHNKIYKRCNAEENDILLICVGATIGRTCIVPKMEEFSLARSVALIKPNFEKLNSQFLNSYLSLDYIQSRIKKSSNTSAQAGLYTGAIKKFKIILPPLSLQTQFAEKIKNIEAQKNLLKKQAKQSEHLFQALLQESFQ